MTGGRGTSGTYRDFDEKSGMQIQNILPSIERTFFQIGSTIGKYRILEEIDRGGMAVVYKAMQLDLKRVVALKVLPANITINRRFVDRFHSEAEAVARLQHPNIVTIHEVAVENNVYYIAMDYIPGMNLYYYLNFRKPKLVEVIEIAATIAEALSYAHKQKIIHRDLKLNNIIMRDNAVPVLIDFGLAKALEGEDAGLTKTGEILGSPAYMAPERLAGAQSDARSDICSLGIMLYEMLTFKNPYFDPRSLPQTTMNVMNASPLEPRKLVPWLPPQIEAITLKAMHKDPDKRYQTMGEFRDDLLRYRKGEPVSARPKDLLSRGIGFFHSYRAIVVAGLLTVLLASAAALNVYIDKKKNMPHPVLRYSEDFAGPGLGPAWDVPAPAPGESSRWWSMRNHRICSPPLGSSFIRLRRAFTRDMRVEFDIRGGEQGLSNAGLFLGGSCPDSGYCFHLFAGPQARCGISCSGSGFLFAEYDPAAFTPGGVCHVVAEKKDGSFTFTINAMPVAALRDYFSPVGKDHQGIGFFSNGPGWEIGNLKVFSYVVSRPSGTSAVADRFAQRGEFGSALNEYEDLLPGITGKEASYDIRLKICESQIRMGCYDSARQLLRGMPASGIKSIRDLSKRLFLEGVLNDKSGRETAADSAYAALFTRLPGNPLCESAMTNMILRIEERLRHNDPSGAERTMEVLENNYQGDLTPCGPAHLMIMRYYIDQGAFARARAAGERMLEVYNTNNDVLLSAREVLGEVYMAVENQPAALRLLNECVASQRHGEAFWQAWLQLAAIDEYDDRFADAYGIYGKVYSECPKNLIFAWMARIKSVELCPRLPSAEQPGKIFDDLLQPGDPFPLPRLIAQFYKGALSRDEFLNAWKAFYPSGHEYLRCYAKKALLDHDGASAVKYFAALKRGLSPNSWAAREAAKELSLVKK